MWKYWPNATELAEQVGGLWTERQRLEYALTLLAIMKPESGGNPKAVGDNGHSIGLFQMHDAGAGAGMSVQQRQLPEVQFVHARKAFTPWFEAYTAAGLDPIERATATGHNGQRPAGYFRGYDEDKDETFVYNGVTRPRTYFSSHYGEAYAKLLATAEW